MASFLCALSHSCKTTCCIYGVLWFFLSSGIAHSLSLYFLLNSGSHCAVLLSFLKCKLQCMCSAFFSSLWNSARKHGSACTRMVDTWVVFWHSVKAKWNSFLFGARIQQELNRIYMHMCQVCTSATRRYQDLSTFGIQLTCVDQPSTSDLDCI